MSYSFEFEHEQELDNGEVRNLLVCVYFDKYQELYGADADGNRGEIVWFTDDIQLMILDEGGYDITDSFAQEYPREFAEISTRADELTDEFDVDETDEDDYCYDDYKEDEELDSE